MAANKRQWWGNDSVLLQSEIKLFTRTGTKTYYTKIQGETKNI